MLGIIQHRQRLGHHPSQCRPHSRAPGHTEEEVTLVVKVGVSEKHWEERSGMWVAGRRVGRRGSTGWEW